MRDQWEIDLLSEVRSYIADRDAMQKAHANQSAFMVASRSGDAMVKFSGMVDAHAAAVGGILPPMSLAELQGLSELINSRLAAIRMVTSQKG